MHQSDLVEARSSRYLWWLAGTVLAVMALVAAFNVLIDPLGIYPSPTWRSVNATKPHLDHHRELSRWVAAKRLCAPVGLFGNSRVEIGLDPESTALPAPAFNHAIPGTSSRTTLSQLNWLAQAGCFPKRIVLGVDFFDFLGGDAPLPLPTLSSDPAPTLDAKAVAETAFSLSAAADALATLRLQHQPRPALLTARGFNPLLNYHDEVSQHGHQMLFEQRAQENFRRWSGRPPQIRPGPGLPSDDELVLAAILDKAAAQTAPVELVIYPYHALIRLMIDRLALEPAFNEWKRLVLAQAARSNAAGGRVRVWDFSGLSPWTLEPIPAAGDRQTRMAYFWEAGHFKKETGDLVLQRMFAGQGDFGVELDAPRLDALVQSDAAALARLKASGTPWVSRAQTWLDRWSAQRPRRAAPAER